MKRLKLAVIMLVLLVMLLAALPAGAVTDGELDGNGHPHVVLLITEVDGAPAWRCSATLISPTVVLTAGHCVSNFPDEGEVTGMRIFTESDVQNGNNNYPFAGPNSVEAKSWAAHPLYETGPFFLHDAGVVVLSKAVKLKTYGKLPALNSLDSLSPGASTLFTSVGYGLQASSPVDTHTTALKIRMVAHPHLVQINTPGFTGDFSLLLSNNANTGGTCFGDSGGPNFLGDSNVVAGVTSYGLNGNCAGTGGVFRVDRANVLDFVKSFLK
jgi:hypothetical protein